MLPARAPPDETGGRLQSRAALGKSLSRQHDAESVSDDVSKLARGLLLADIGHVCLREPDEVGGLEANGLVVGACLEHEPVPFGYAPVDEHLLATRAAERRDRSELELRVVAREIVLARQVPFAADGLPNLAEVEPVRRARFS